MFVLACKETGCVKLVTAEHPNQALTLSSNVYDHFNLYEFNDSNDYTGKFLKVINNELHDMGSFSELEAQGSPILLDCDKCPSLFSV